MSLPLNENLNRRQLFSSGVALGTTLAVAGLSARANAADATPAATPATSAALSSGDQALITWGLTIERLLASYYAQVLEAHTTRAYLSPRALELATEMAANENAHVTALEAALGEGNVPTAQRFVFPNTSFVSPIGFAWLGYTLAEIAIGAHLTALPRLSNPGLKSAAAAIIASESRHAALLRTLSGFDPAPRYFESPITEAQVNSLIAPYIKAA